MSFLNPGMPSVFVCILTVRESFLVELRHWGTGEPSKDKFLRRDHYKDFDLVSNFFCKGNLRILTFNFVQGRVVG